MKSVKCLPVQIKAIEQIYDGNISRCFKNVEVLTLIRIGINSFLMAH